MGEKLDKQEGIGQSYPTWEIENITYPRDRITYIGFLIVLFSKQPYMKRSLSSLLPSPARSKFWLTV